MIAILKQSAPTQTARSAVTVVKGTSETVVLPASELVTMSVCTVCVKENQIMHVSVTWVGTEMTARKTVVVITIRAVRRAKEFAKNVKIGQRGSIVNIVCQGVLEMLRVNKVGYNVSIV